MGTIFHWWWFGVRMWWWKFRNYANDRAVIRVVQGPFHDDELATRRCITKDGNVFQYGKHIVLVHADHPYTIWEDEHVIYVVDGEVIASPVKGTGKQLDESLISSFTEGNAVTELSESMEAPAQGGMGFKQLRWVLLIVAVAVILFVVYKFVLHGHIPGTAPAVTPTPTPTPSPMTTPHFSLNLWAIWARGVIGV
jgi:hypothetical protein